MIQAQPEIAHVESYAWPRTIGEVMTAGPVPVRPGQPLVEAHAIMRSLGVHHLPVVDHGRVVGIVSQDDLHLVESLDRRNACQVTVEEAMVQRPYLVAPDEPLTAVLGAMVERHIGAVLVTESGRLVGIFTAVDAISALRRLTTAHGS